MHQILWRQERNASAQSEFLSIKCVLHRKFYGNLPTKPFLEWLRRIVTLSPTLYQFESSSKLIDLSLRFIYILRFSRIIDFRFEVHMWPLKQEPSYNLQNADCSNARLFFVWFRDQSRIDSRSIWKQRPILGAVGVTSGSTGAWRFAYSQCHRSFSISRGLILEKRVSGTWLRVFSSFGVDPSLDFGPLITNGAKSEGGVVGARPPSQSPISPCWQDSIGCE